MEQKILTVTDLNNRIKDLFELDPLLQNVCVRGELSNYKVYPSGHHYFTMKDAESSIRCVMFKGSALKLRFKPESGMSVTVFGRVSVYPRDGAYQLYCADMRPDGMGDLHVAFEQLKAKLGADGLFNPEHKKPLPRFPERVALITSGAGAAVRDMIRVAGHRWPMAKLIVLPVRVQGVEAPPEIVGAIRYANKYNVADVIITGRGGGSIEDLWAFNDERVARAIYDSVIPVISAVGHEPDVTIADYVADVRASTPSNGAEKAVPDKSEIYEYLRSAEIRLSQAMNKKISFYRRRLEDLGSRRVLRDNTGYIDQKRMELDFLRTRLENAQTRKIDFGRRRFVQLASKLDALSPLKVITRGYTVAAKNDGTIIRTTADTKVGDEVSLRLTDGSVKCAVTEIERN